MRAHEPPVSGRRRATREKLLRAGLHLFSRAGVDGVTIQEITSEAGVGFGSFYNHFESKQALADALIDGYIADNKWLFDTPEMRALDIAEYLSAVLRFTIERAAADHDWGTFFSRTSSLMISGRKGIVRRLAIDLRRGVRAGRFQITDFDATLFAVIGANNAWLQAILAGEVRRDVSARMAAYTLQMLGLSAEEARAVARRPLPARLAKVLSSANA